MAPLKCCVGGCNATSITHEVFKLPRDDKLRSLWMSLLVPTNSSLLGLTKSQLLTKRVCGKHFDSTQFDVNGTRLRDSYPCLFSEKEMIHGTPLSTEDFDVLNEHNYCSTQERDEADASAAEELIILFGDVSHQMHTYSAPSTSNSEVIQAQLVHDKIERPVDLGLGASTPMEVERSVNVTQATTGDASQQKTSNSEVIQAQLVHDKIERPVDLGIVACTPMEVERSVNVTQAAIGDASQQKTSNSEVIQAQLVHDKIERPVDLGIVACTPMEVERSVNVTQAAIGDASQQKTSNSEVIQAQLVHDKIERPEDLGLGASTPMKVERSVNVTQATTGDASQQKTSNTKVIQAQLVHDKIERPVDLGLGAPTPMEVEGLVNVTQATTGKVKQQKLKTKRFIKECTTIASDSLGNTASERLKSAQALSENLNIMENFQHLNKKVKAFLLMQLRMVRKNKMARRFTLGEKLFAVSIMKNSPKCYKLLASIFALPNKRTLSRVSEKIVFDCGINENVIEHLKNTIKNWDTKKRLCSVVFDEVSLTPHLTYNDKKGRINGFVQIAGQRKRKFADHALVIMLRGICSSWRQSVAYYFCDGTASATELEMILKQIIPKLRETGLTPLALICDQGSTFRACIKSLKLSTARLRSEEGKNGNDITIHLAGSDLFVFHDPPHLLKSIRNNFLNKDILYDGRIASWKDIIYIYDIDSLSGHTRALPNLTAQHVDPKQIKKMQVKAAAQVLSARTAAMLEYTSSLHERLNIENSRMKTTAEVVAFFDELFDSVNGSPGGPKGKLRVAVKPESLHQQFWGQSIKTLKHIKFIDTDSKHAKQAGQPRHVLVPCLHGWISTLESFQGLAKLLFNTYNVEYFYPRFINQDPLENFFGRIRAMNCRNVNPDANAFIYAFKSMIMSNILTPHSKFSNCEEDEGEQIFDVNYLFNQNNDDKENVCPTPKRREQTEEAGPSRKTNVTVEGVIHEKRKIQISAYTAGYICRKITKKINCNSCSKTYTTNKIEDRGIHQYIKYREYKRLKNSNLAYPTEKFLRLYGVVSQKIHNFLDENCHKNKIKKQLINMVNKVDMSWLGCKKHGNQLIKKCFSPLMVRLHCHSWCTRINRVLNGKIEEKHVSSMGNMALMALDKYKKYRLRKKKINK